MCSVDIIATDREFREILKQLSKDGKIRLITMDVLEEQYHHTKVPKNSRDLINELIFEKIESDAFVFGVSDWGSKWGNGSLTGMSVNSIMSSKGNHLEDALIAVTSVGNADVFVTEDKKLMKKMIKRQTKCEVWDSIQLKQYLLDVLKDLNL